MAEAHGEWIAEFFRDISDAEIERLMTLLGRSKDSVRSALARRESREQSRRDRLPLRTFQPEHFGLAVDGKVATVTLSRPERKNPLTFESYAELRDFFRALPHEKEVKAIVLTGAGGISPPAATCSKSFSRCLGAICRASSSSPL
jgi:hypothetical protein